MRLKRRVVGMVLMGAALAAHALTVGKLDGSAWIGSPLNLTVPIQLEPGAASGSLCPSVEVFYGDNKLDAANIQVTLEPSTEPELVRLRLKSLVAVDEPIVTALVRVGCDEKVTRRSVILADLPSAAEPIELAVLPPPTAPLAPPSSAAQTAATVTLLTAQVAASTKPDPMAAPPRERTAKSKPSARTVERRAAQLAQPSQRAVPPTYPSSAPTDSAKKAEPPNAARPRLKLDPIDILNERIMSLETTNAAIVSEERTRDAQRIEQLQSDMKALRQQAAQNGVALQLMRERLEKAEEERDSRSLMYGFAALVMVASVALVFFWQRKRNSLSEALEEADLEPVAADTWPPPDTTRAYEVTPPPSMTQFTSRSEKLLVNSLPLAPTLQTRPPLGNNRVNEHPDFNQDSQFDMLLQAEYFDQLGKTHEAVDALEASIRTHSRETPLLYLELLRIANARNLKMVYGQGREACQQVFNVTIPEFPLFLAERRGLEDYPSLLVHITNLWPSARLLDMLESCILHDPFEKNPEPFELAAFKDLVLLHGIASQLLQPTVDDAMESTDSEPLDLAL